MTRRHPPGEDISLSDGRTRPATRPEKTPSQERVENEPDSFIKGMLRPIRNTWTELYERLPFHPLIGISGVFAYFLVLVVFAMFSGVLRAFGLLSLTTGGVILYTVYHPTGNIEIETPFQKYVYAAGGAAFILVGIQYLLHGILWG